MSQSKLVDDYLAGIDSLQPVIDGLTPEQLRTRPIVGQWSTLEVICHLADTEALFAERMKRVIAEDRPPLLYADPDAFAAKLAVNDRDPAEEFALIRATRQQMARILRAQPPEVWQRIGVHNKAGDQTLEQLVRKAVDHLQHHIGFIRTKREAMQMR